MSNKLFLLPIAYLGNIEYYSILLNSPRSSIEQYEYFVKQSIRSRCEIYSANGILTLSIPKQRKGSSKTLVKDIQISYATNWQKNHWNSIKSAYNTSPFFMYYKDNICKLFKKKEKFLLDFNLKAQDVLLQILDINQSPDLTKRYESKTNKIDLRKYPNIITRHKPYEQVFSQKYGFKQNLSIIDLLFNLGPESKSYLRRTKM